MSRVLWQKENSNASNKQILSFTAGNDVLLDHHLFPYDILATQAHVRGLARINILDESEADLLCEGLRALSEEFWAGNFVLDQRYEDGHSAIEFYLSEKCPKAGPKVHTGRSRNDQVAVATRLYMKDVLSLLSSLCQRIASECLKKAETHAMTPMPGYTHLQRAVPSSVGLWMASFVEAFIDNVSSIKSTLAVIDSCPLGSAAGYGVNLPLDRQGCADELGFERVQISPMYVQNSRGKFELMCLDVAGHCMMDLRRLAWDLSLFSSAEFAFVAMPDEYTTGSSIMPNKRNPDVVELMRSSVASVLGAQSEIRSILSLPSGYQRDLQHTKAPLIRGLNTTLTTLRLVPELIAGLTFNEDAMRSAISPDMFATDVAVKQTASGVPFRQAYLDAKEAIATMTNVKPETSLKDRVSLGGCGNLGLDHLRQRLDLIQT